MRIHRSLVALLGVAALAACGDKAERSIDAPVPTTSAIRFFNFGVNAPAVQFYADDQKITAATSASCQAAKNPPVTATDSLCLTVGIQSTGGVAYGQVSSGSLYNGMDAGQYTFNGRIMTANGPTTTISSVPAKLESGKFYSYYQSGFYNTTTKTTDAFVVEDVLPTTIDWNNTLVRFVNTISNSQPMTLFAINTTTKSETALGSTVAYKAAGAFTTLAPGIYDLQARTAGGTVAITRTNVQFLAGHVYTISSRGDMTVTSTTAANRPFLDNTANQ